MADIKLIHFVNGEDVLGEILEETEQHFVVKNPCHIGLAQDQNGKPSLSLQPLVIFSKQEVVDLQKSHYIYCVDVDQGIVNQYNEIFGNIIVPSQSIFKG